MLTSLTEQSGANNILCPLAWITGNDSRDITEAMNAAARPPTARGRQDSCAQVTIQRQSQISTLEHCFTQYDTLKRIAGNLTSVDLFRLATTSKSVWSLIKERESAWNNLNAKAACDGYGVRYRAEHLHQSFLHKINYLVFDPPVPICGAHDTMTIESRPCVKCRRVVCNECRIHVAYRANFKIDMDRQPDQSAEGLLDIPIKGLQHVGMNLLLNPDVEIATVPSSVADSGDYKNPHDKGILRGEAQGASSFDPATFPCHDEIVEDLVDIDLGARPHERWYSIELEAAKDSRIRWVCVSCLGLKGSPGQQNLTGSIQGDIVLGSYFCDCTLRSHFLDRWLCIPCYRAELAMDLGPLALTDSYSLGTRQTGRRHVLGFWGFLECACGNHEAMVAAICKWCGGEIVAEKFREQGPLMA